MGVLQRAKEISFATALSLIVFIVMHGSPAIAQVPRSSHVFLVILENYSYNTVTNAADSNHYMPWLISKGNAYGYAANYLGNSSGSLLDYLWLSSGSCHGDPNHPNNPTFACDLPPGTTSFGCSGGSCWDDITDNNIYREMLNRGISWKLYAESIPYAGYMGSNILDEDSPYYQCCRHYNYRHNPPRWYSDVINSTAEQQKMVPLTQYVADLDADQLPQYSIIIPNDNNNAHDNIPAQADAWLEQNLTPLLNSPYFQPCGDGILIITWDVGDDDRRDYVYTAVIGPRVKRNFVSNTFYQHQHALRTILEALGIDTYPGDSANVSAMSDFFEPSCAAPAVTGLSPSRITAGSQDFTLTVSGSNFSPGAVVQWNGSDRSTTFVSASQLKASIPAGDVATPGTAQVTVSDPSRAGETSNAATFTIDSINPSPSIAGLAPNALPAGGDAFEMSVSGADFVSGSVVQWNGSSRPTTFVSSSQLRASIPAADIAVPGSAQVTVVSPAPGGGNSNLLTFSTLAAGVVPKINSGGVVNGASFSRLRLAGAAIASVFGSNFSSSTIEAVSLPLPRVLGGVNVLIDGETAPLFVVTPNQINFQIPWEVLGHSQASIIVMVNGIRSAQETMDLESAGPALFATNQQGFGQGAILIASSGELAAPSGSIPGRAARPARRGEFITIYATGLGSVTNPPATGSPASASTLSVTTTTPVVMLGGRAVAATDGFFSGLAPSFVGLYQVNVQVPPDAPAGDAIEISLNLGGILSNTTTIAIE